MAILYARAQSNGTGNGGGVTVYDTLILNIVGDGSTKTVSLSLIDAPFSLQFSNKNLLTSALVTFADASFGATTATVSGYVVTITFTNAPSTSFFGGGIQISLMYGFN